MSNVVIFYGQRRATIRTTPSKSLSEIRTEACTRFNLTPPSSFFLKRGQSKLDLSLPWRLTGLSPGAKIDLVKSSEAVAPVSVTLRTVVEPVDELSGSFLPSETIFNILRSFEKDAHAAGRKNFNITQRFASSKGAGAGRLMYEMPAVRVANRELANFQDLQKTLEDMGCVQGRTLLVLRYKPTDIPLEEALQQIANFSTEEPEERVPASEKGMETDDKEPPVEATDVQMSDAPQPNSENITPNESQPRTQGDGAQEVKEQGSRSPQPPSISVYQPPESTTIAAANFEVADSDYEMGINDLKRLKESYHKESLNKRLLSDKEIEEKEVADRARMESIDSLKIKIRYPDGYITDQSLSGKSTAQDLYSAVRATMRYPTEPFTLWIPPREVIDDIPKRLTVDLKLRSGATLHLSWSKEASAKARKEKALKDELLKASQQLPKPVAPEPLPDTPEEEETPPKEKPKDKGKNKENFENKMKGLLRLGRK